MHWLSDLSVFFFLVFVCRATVEMESILLQGM